MRLAAALLLVLAFWSSAAEARHRHHVHHHRHHDVHRQAGSIAAPSLRTGLVTVPTAAGLPITVAAHLADRFTGFIADLVSSGYRPRHIGCYASGGHIRNSRHYAGAACDFDQRGWGLTARFMYGIRALAESHGLRDGCTFRRRDCGHVDDLGHP